MSHHHLQTKTEEKGTRIRRRDPPKKNSKTSKPRKPILKKEEIGCHFFRQIARSFHRRNTKELKRSKKEMKTPDALRKKKLLKGRKRRAKSLSKLVKLSFIQGVSKKGNRTLQCSNAFIIQSTEIILSQAERPGF